MKVIYDDMTLYNFNAWSSAVSTKKAIIAAGKADEFDELIGELYPEGITATQLNDILWFDEWIYEALGMSEEDEDDYADEEE